MSKLNKTKKQKEEIPKVYARFEGDELWQPLLTHKSLKKKNLSKEFKLNCKIKDNVKNSTDTNGEYHITIILPENIASDNNIIYWTDDNSCIQTQNKCDPYKDLMISYQKTKSKGNIKAENWKATFNITCPKFSKAKFLEPYVYFNICNTNIIWSSKLHKKKEQKKIELNMDTSPNYLSEINKLWINFILIIFIFSIIVLFGMKNR
jgi:hypothetical protein